MSKRTLVSWVGRADLSGINAEPIDGPLQAIMAEREFDQCLLLVSYSLEETQPLIDYLKRLYPHIAFFIYEAKLRSPTHVADIYTAFESAIKQLQSKSDLTIQLTSGTPSMTAVSILLGKSKYNAAFVQSSKQQGVEDAEVPFDIAADFLPAIVKKQSETLIQLNEAKSPYNASFESIITRDPAMKALIARASQVAQWDVPVLILGETGTGKELFAKAIVSTSNRAGKPFKTINCGALSPELLDATLFGHTKGAFTGAATAKKGYFEECHGGTLFLDEFGELSPEAQVRLLRVMQEGTFTPLGSTEEVNTDVRIIAATHKDLVAEMHAGRFREDLFYRVAIGVLNLPPLRSRQGDVSYLAEYLLEQQNKKFSNSPAAKGKKISAAAKNIMLKHSWPGNIREMQATLLRASLWRESETITEQDMQEALLERTPVEHGLLNQPFSESFDLKALQADFAQQYIEKALQQSNGNKTNAASLLGFNNYQTLNNWMKKTQK